MTTTANLRGTLFPSFGIGKSGITLFQGTGAPNDVNGTAGDLYIRANGALSIIYQKQGTAWVGFSGTGSVTSVAIDGGTSGIAVTGSPITNSGTISLSLGTITPSAVSAVGAVTGSNLSGTNTGDQTIQLSGDITTSNMTSGTYNTTLGATGVTAGTYGSQLNTAIIVVDAKGRITSASTGTNTFGTGSVTSLVAGTGLSGGTITDTGTVSISTNGISNALFRQSAASSLVGNSAGTTGNVADITLGTGLTFTGTTLAIGTSGVTAGTYNKVTVDALGRISVGTLDTTANVGLDGTTNGTMYIPWVSTGTAGNQQLEISPDLKWNPATGLLAVTKVQIGTMQIGDLGSGRVFLNNTNDSSYGTLVSKGLEIHADPISDFVSSITVSKSSLSIKNSKYIAYATTTGTLQTELLLGDSAGQIVIANDTTVHFTIKLVGRRTDVDGENLGIKFEGMAVRNTNAASTSIIGTVVEDRIEDPATTTWLASVSTDVTTGALVIYVTGAASKTIKWSAVIDTLEVTG